MLPPIPHGHTLLRYGAITLLTVSTLTLGMAPAAATPRSPEPADDDIADRLEEVPGLTVVSETDDAPEGFRHFLLEFEQPADHTSPEGQTFNQRMTLLHRGLDQPTVLHSGGYTVQTDPFRAEPTELVDGNQLSVEHRFFSPSRPDPADWDDLTIGQAATDHHRVVEAINDIYENEWLSTGASKGGMTSVYHRRFYPDDVDGTVAYVAPNDVDDEEDSAYLEFFDEVGTDPQCQQDLEALQRATLERRDEFVGYYEDRAEQEGWTFGRNFADADAAFEIMAVEFPWMFWQYETQDQCGTIPAPDSATGDIAQFLDEVYGWDRNTDEGVEPYVPYFHQAASQLGFPSVPTDHVDDLLEYPDLFHPTSYLPDDIAAPEIDESAMPDIDGWVRDSGERLMFVDGEFDPWGAEPFRVDETADNARYVAPEANHGADIAALAPDDRSAATETVLRWAGTDTDDATTERVPELDDGGERERAVP